MPASAERVLSFIDKDGCGTKVLLVDDDVELSSMLRQYSENERFHVAVQFS